MDLHIKVTDFKIGEPITKQEEINLAKREVLEEVIHEIYRITQKNSGIEMFSLLKLKTFIESKIAKLVFMVED